MTCYHDICDFVLALFVPFVFGYAIARREASANAKETK